MYRFHPQINIIIDLIKNHVIGELLSMESYFGSDILTKKNFLGFKLRKKPNEKNRIFNKNLGGGAILDLGCYTTSFSSLIASLKSEFKTINVINKKKETIWKGHGLMLIGDFYFSRKEYIKAKDFYTQILTINNLQPELYDQAKMKLLNIDND